jgi:hypothetical protein
VLHLNLRQKIRNIHNEIVCKEIEIIERFPDLYESEMYLKINNKNILFYNIEHYGIFKINISDMEIKYYSEKNERTEEEIKEIINILRNMALTIKLTEMF